MNPQLEHLCDLQDIDLTIKKIEQELFLLPIEIQRITEEFEKEKEVCDVKKRQLDELEKQRRERERELNATELKLQKFNTQLLSVKTNKEYTALLHEIEITKSEISKIEEAILHLFDEIENVEKALKKEKARIEKDKISFENRKKQIDDKLKQRKNQLEAFNKKRKHVEEQIEKHLIREYKKIYQARKGLAIAQVKDQTCLGCNMALMPQLFQEIITQVDEIFRCPNCNRILFYKIELNNE